MTKEIKQGSDRQFQRDSGGNSEVLFFSVCITGLFLNEHVVIIKDQSL